MSKQPLKRAIKQQRAARTREEILDAAIREFARRSFEGTSMVQLAHAIHMTPGALYWHFPTKEDLLLAAVEELHARFMKDFMDLVTQMKSMPAKQQLLAFLDRVRNFFRYHPEYGKFFSMMMALSTVMNDRVSQAVRDPLLLYSTLVEKIVRHGQFKTGEFRTDIEPTIIGHMVIGMLSGLVLQQSVFQEELSYEMLSSVLDRVTVDGLTVGATGRPAPAPALVPDDAQTTTR